MFLIVSVLLLSVYGITLLISIRFLKYPGINSATPHTERFTPSVSIIISFRNEREHLTQLLIDLSNLRYDGYKEFILVDDHSEDHPQEIIQSYPLSGLQYLQPSPSAVGKKLNLTRAIQQAKGEIILTTDADCRIQPKWITAMIPYFKKPLIQMVLGPVNLKEENYFERLQSLEYLSLMAVTRICTNLGKPIMANGGNLAYRKSAFIQVGGYDGNLHVSSGDDEFLMRKIQSVYEESIAYSNYPNAFIVTNAAKNLIQFFHQRVRWAGKMNYQTNWLSKTLAFAILAVQLISAGFILQIIFAPVWIHLLLCVKYIPEYLLLRSTAKLHNKKIQLIDFFLISLIYPFYIMIIGLLSLFIQPNWKGRRVQT